MAPQDLDWLGSLSEDLPDDERIIFLAMYQRTPWLYEAVFGSLFILTNTKTNEVEMVWESLYRSRFVNDDSWVVDSRMLHVRVRESDATCMPGELISPEEYKANPGSYTILDVVCCVARVDQPSRTEIITVDAYESCHDIYELLGMSYVVVPSHEGVIL